MKHSCTQTEEDQILHQYFRDLGLDIADVDLERCGPIVGALLRGLKRGAVEAGLLANRPSIEPEAIGRVIAGLRGDEEARQACSLADMRKAADALEVLLRLERMSSGWIDYVCWKAAPVVENNAVWLEVIAAAKSSVGHREAEALECALNSPLSQSEIGVLLADLIKESSNGLTQSQITRIVSKFVYVEKESLDKAIRRRKTKMPVPKPK